MKEVVLDTLIDGFKILPFLFVAFLLIELLEHKLSNKNKKLIEKSGKFGPIIGSILGVFPQCGFSAFATNLYVTRIITLGTLIAVYLSTSDEMLPILISNNVSIWIILKILLLKLVIGMIFGFIIDLFIKRKETNYHMCEEEHCHCEESIIKSSLKHTINTFIFILIIEFILNIIFAYFGEEYINKILQNNNVFMPFLTALIGLIPNCGASIIITELYLNNILTLSSVISGLLTSAGVGLIILFERNKNLKENIKIVLILYIIGVLSGLICELIGLM